MNLGHGILPAARIECVEAFFDTAAMAGSRARAVEQVAAMNPPDVSLELLRRYNVPGPRYTSYPTAPIWKESYGAADYAAILAESAPGTAAGTALALLPPALLREALLLLRLHGRHHRARITGRSTLTSTSSSGRSTGSPSAPARTGASSSSTGAAARRRTSLPTLLERLGRRILERFRLAPDAEIGVEIDPRVTTPEHLETLARLGFNRLSMGVQDFDPRVQEAINRIQPYDATRRLVEEARALGFPSVNMDLIYGLPHQTPETFSATIDRVLEIGPDRLAVYSYANVPWMKKHQNVLAPHLPDEATKFGIFRTALERFTDAGFEYIGMDHFARPTTSWRAPAATGRSTATSRATRPRPAPTSSASA